MPNKKKIFIVHGRDKRALKEIENIVLELNAEPIILNDQNGLSETIIELIERHSDVSFAIILLTPDDWGRKKRTKKDNPRARQNVIFELGYFFAKLNRKKRVMCLVKGDVERPSDIDGIRYTHFAKSVSEIKERIVNNYTATFKSKKLVKARERKKLVGKILFNFDPILLKQYKWDITLEKPNNIKPVINLISDNRYGKVWQIQTNYIKDYYMQRYAPDIETNGKEVSFIVKRSQNQSYALYCMVNVIKQDTNICKKVWLNIHYGIGTSKPLSSDPDHEWIVYVRSRIINQDWMSLHINLPQMIEETYGRDGWKFNQLFAYRIRGNITLAEIIIYG